MHAMDRKQLYCLVPFESRFNWYLKRLCADLVAWEGIQDV